MVEVSRKPHIEVLCSVLKCLLVQIHWVFDCIVDFIFGLYYDHKAKKVPPVENPLLLESAIALARKIRARNVTSEEVVRAFVTRCKEVNDLINAVVDERYEDAIKEAKEVDEFLKILFSKDFKICEAPLMEKYRYIFNNPDLLEQEKPLLGVPFTTKESNEAKGLLHSMGLICRKDYRSKEDSTIVGFVKNAGGILIAKTNIPELNLWTESRNNVYGQTNNPYNTTRTVGGSSGGEGAIIASCGSAFSIGSDIGGSTRMPAFFNGVFGHKPTEGMTPLKGVGLRQEDYINSMAEAGPICKKAEDLLPLLKIFVGKRIVMLKLHAAVNIQTLNIFYQKSSGDLRASKVNEAMRTTLMKAVLHFKEITGSATKIKLPGSEYTFRLWRYWMSEELNFKYDITNRRYCATAMSEVYKLLTGKSELTFAAILKLLDEDLLPKDKPEWAKSVTENMKKYLLDKLGGNGILFYPSSPYPAGYHYSPYFRPYNFGYWCIFNVLRLPTCQVPLGLDKHGLPVGVQVVAAPYNDHLCFAVARELERAFGGWVPPS